MNSSSSHFHQSFLIPNNNNNNVNVVHHQHQCFLENPQTGSNPSSHNHEERYYSCSNKENKTNILNTIQPQTNYQGQGRIKKITWFLSSAPNHHNHVDDDDDDDEKKLQNKPHCYSCHICNKDFSSNKALNGHMRWHSQKGSKKGNTESSFLEQNNNINKTNCDVDQLGHFNNHVDDDDGKKQLKKPHCYSCHVCIKVFSSIKALNGHMRWHWHPQKGSKKGNSNTASSLLEQNKTNYDVDQLGYFNKRRKCNTFVIDDDDTREAAQTLLDMSCGKFLNFDVNNIRDSKSYCQS